MRCSLPPNISAELVSVGTELLLGEITDTNSVFMARALRDIGVNVFFMISVGDNRQRIADTIRSSLERSDVIITCGGLGPTVDDMTRHGIADATNCPLEFREDLMEMIAARFEKYGVKMTENNRQQAYVPANASVIKNPVGTAPAFIVEVGAKCVISLPGVPRELKYLFNESVIPFLREKYNISNQIILARILKTAGIGESSLDTLLGRKILEGHNPTVGLAAHSGQIDIRVTAKADTRELANKMIDKVEAIVRAHAGDYIFGVDDDELETVLAKLLEDHNALLTLTEAGTAGVIHERLGPVLKDQLSDSLIANSPQEIAETLNISHMSDLLGLAQQAAQTARQRHNASLAIAVLSQPDVDEGADIEMGTVVVVCTEEKMRHRVYGFGGRSDNVRQFVGNWGTAVAWRMAREVFTSENI
jgi:nicotinamide-nucleotide amidase